MNIPQIMPLYLYLAHINRILLNLVLYLKYFAQNKTLQPLEIECFIGLKVPPPRRALDYFVHARRELGGRKVYAKSSHSNCSSCCSTSYDRMFR